MTDRKVVMISSTVLDLPEHREQVRLGCERAGFEPRMMMENLTALDTDAVDISRRMVDEADVYLSASLPIVTVTYRTDRTSQSPRWSTSVRSRRINLG